MSPQARSAITTHSAELDEQMIAQSLHIRWSRLPSSSYIGTFPAYNAYQMLELYICFSAISHCVFSPRIRIPEQSVKQQTDSAAQLTS